MRLFLIGIFWVGGAVLGWNTAAATHSSRNHAAVIAKQQLPAPVEFPRSMTLVVVPVPAAPLQTELERLTTRNRRLEALVRVLRNRQPERQP